jgi:hypothetical protein
MSNTRIKLTYDHSLPAKLNYLQNQLNALKAAPQQLGGSSVVFFTSQTDAAYDWSGNVPSSGDPVVFLLVSATAENSAVLYANLIAQIFVGSPTDWYRPSEALGDQVAGHIPFFTSVTVVPSPSGTPASTLQWVVGIEGDPARTAYAKFFVNALDNVTLTVEVL